MIKATLFSTLFVLMSIINLNAQQLPQEWVGDKGIETFKESTEVHHGSNAVKVKVNTDEQAQCDFQMENKTAISGSTFKLTFWGKTSQHVRIKGIIDWTGADATQPEVYIDEANSEWTQFVLEGEVPVGATEASIRIRFYDKKNAGFVPGEICYVDEVNFECPAGTAVSMPNTDFEGWDALKEAPSNYPTQFRAIAGATGVNVQWTDAVGTVLPDHYLVVGSATNTPIPPVDNQVYADNLDFTAGNIIANVNSGVQSINVEGALNGSTYYFWIYPYSNNGLDAKFKTDGTVPSYETVIESFATIYTQGFDDNLGDWTTFSETGDQAWEASAFGDRKYAKMNGYDGVNKANIDWLISPAFDFSTYGKASITFENAQGHKAIPLKLMVSTNYDGNGNPTAATWTELSAIWAAADPFWSWTNSGSVILNDYLQNNVYVAFVYTSTEDAAGTWEIDNFSVAGLKQTGIENDVDRIEFSMYPNPCKGQLTVNVQDKNTELQVINLVGTVVKSQIMNEAKNSVELSKLPAGIYMVRIFNEENAQSIKRIILK